MGLLLRILFRNCLKFILTIMELLKKQNILKRFQHFFLFFFEKSKRDFSRDFSKNRKKTKSQKRAALLLMCLDFNAHASASELQELISVSVILFRVGFRELKMHEKIKHATIPMHPNKLLKFKYSRTVTLKRLANCFGLVILKT